MKSFLTLTRCQRSSTETCRSQSGLPASCSEEARSAGCSCSCPHPLHGRHSFHMLRVVVLNTWETIQSPGRKPASLSFTYFPNSLDHTSFIIPINIPENKHSIGHILGSLPTNSSKKRIKIIEICKENDPDQNINLPDHLKTAPSQTPRSS